MVVDPVEYRPTIHDLPEGERPRERLERRGEAALNNTELLAILLRTGIPNENVLHVAERLLAKYHGLGGLARAGFSELAQERGLGAAKVAQIKAALELGRRCVSESPETRPLVTSPASAANLLQAEMGVLDQEHLRTILLDTKNRVLSVNTVAVGSLNANHVRISELFREAIRANSASIIVAHNHPSGDPTPSPEDVAVTRQIVQAGDLIDIKVLDHLIFGRQRFVSLKERGLGFGP